MCTCDFFSSSLSRWRCLCSDGRRCRLTPPLLVMCPIKYSTLKPQKLQAKVHETEDINLVSSRGHIVRAVRGGDRPALLGRSEDGRRCCEADKHPAK
ncbi:hypothetical protein E2C01_070993 [Portunus trituberculatus]|uniref:Uncharacterized protein n=1 Tax=Portunus trituberculatus TaxID=210409 RepID=A0A5B7I6T9_PORTR|nr:hypothetical protein [Portunus trituberculatus]